MKYRVYMVCFGFYLQDMYNTADEAYAKGQSTGFVFRVDEFSQVY